MSLDIFSGRIFRKWRLLRRVKETQKIASLPFELCQPIIDNLSDDQAALRACSLTCKAFLHASRQHLFHSVRLDSEEELTRFLDKICFTESPTNPRTYVRELSVYEGHQYRFVSNTDILVTCLPNITSLNLYRFHWVMPDHGRRGKRLLGFRKVQRLLLQGIFQTSRQTVSWGAYYKSGIPLPCSLKSITVQCNQSHVFNRLLRLESHPNISTLCLGVVYSKYAEDMGDLLKTIGSHLEHLQLTECDGGLAKAIYANHINLAHNTHLRSVRLFFSTAMHDNVPTLDWVCALFSQITSHHMEDVWLLLPACHFIQPEVFFPSIERVFIQQHWSNLRQFRFDYSPPEKLKPMEVYMPILHRHGVILLATCREIDDSEAFSDV